MIQPPALGPRLATIAQMVTEKRVADIGTDHAYLPVFLIWSGKCQKVIATDVHEKPLQAAALHVERYGMTHQIELRQCDGLAGFLPGEAKQFVVAGMGGELIARILQGCPFPKKGVSFLLQPMTRAPALRLYLSTAGFQVTEERAVCEGKHVYSVMRAIYTGRGGTLDALTARIGRVCEFPGAAWEYMNRERQKLIKELAGAVRENPERALELQRLERTISERMKGIEQSLERV